ncbi:MAG: amino acid permease, partial [Ginsengibacter sp.]
AGIFVLPAVVAATLGTAGILAYLFCGVLLSLIMLCYAETGSKIICTGGSYAYIESAFGKYAGFLTANIFVVGASITADAAVANALADTISFALPLFRQSFVRILFFAIIFSGLVALNIRGVKQGMRLVKFNTVAKLLPLLFIITFGFSRVSFSNLEWTSIPPAYDLGKMCLLLFFAFIGGETGLNVSGEIKNPSKTIPRGIFIAVISVLTVYILIHVVAQGMLGPSLTKYKDAPLAEVARKLVGPFGVTLMLFGAGISMFGYLSGEILNMPRIIYGAARDNVIPIKSLSKVHPKYATPYIAIIVYSSLSFTLAVIGQFQQLAMLASASMLIIYLGVAAAVIKLRITNKHIAGSFNIPGGYTVPVLSIVAILWFLSNLSGKEMLGMLIFLSLLSIIYLIIHFGKKKIVPMQGIPGKVDNDEAL